MVRRVVCAILALLCSAGIADAQGNLRRTASAPLDELQLVPLLLRNTTRVHLDEVESLLRPILAALPRDETGHAVHRVARYALVRYFLVYRGWYIKGLAKPGAVWNEFPSDSVYESAFPRLLLRYIETTLHKKAIGIEDLVSIVAAVETLVQSNVEDVLLLVYDTLKLSADQPLRSTQEEQRVLRTFTAFMFQPSSQKEIAEKPVDEFLEEMRTGDYYGKGFWADVDTWAGDTAEMARRQLPNPFVRRTDFASMTTMASAISGGMGSFQLSECQSMKHTLIDMGGGETGRISLANFYRPYLEGDRWDFSESAKYLDFIGVLETSGERQKFVSIPNYVSSWGNCLETSSFHQICCINECELLMMDIETVLNKPFVAPGELASVVSGLPSDTVAAPRNLSEPLLRRLDEIASRNRGLVPLHSRSFSEWMHRAFPSECPMPTDVRLHKGVFDEKDKLATEAEKLEVIGQDTSSNETENVASSAAEDLGGDELQMPWSESEDLLTDMDWEGMKATEQDKVTAVERPGWGRTCLRALAVCAVVAATLSRLLPSGNTMLAVLHGRKPKDKLWLP